MYRRDVDSPDGFSRHELLGAEVWWRWAGPLAPTSFPSTLLTSGNNVETRICSPEESWREGFTGVVCERGGWGGGGGSGGLHKHQGCCCSKDVELSLLWEWETGGEVGVEGGSKAPSLWSLLFCVADYKTPEQQTDWGAAGNWGAQQTAVQETQAASINSAFLRLPGYRYWIELEHPCMSALWKGWRQFISQIQFSC